MEYNELERILLYLSNSLNESNDTIFKEKVSYFKSELERLKYNIPSIEEIEKLEIELETKYDLLLELNNYFDPIYIKLLDDIHKRKVNEIRNQNRLKREEKINGKF